MEEIKLTPKEQINRFLKENYVSKNVIKEKIKWLDEEMEKTGKRLIYANYRYTKNILEELLEEIK